MIAVRQACLVALALLVGIPSLGRATEIRPGQWQLVESGTDDGKPMSEVSLICMTPEQAKDPIMSLLPDSAKTKQCAAYEVKRTPSGTSLRAKCGHPREIAVDLTVLFAVHDKQGFTASLQGTVTMIGTATRLDRKVEGKWVAAECSN
jgi:hypothetical protein